MTRSKRMLYLFCGLLLASPAEITRANSLTQTPSRIQIHHIGTVPNNQTTIGLPPADTSGIALRRVTALEMQLAKPFPKTACQPTAPPLGSVDTCVLGNLDYALAALWINDNAGEIAQANTDIETAINVIGATPGFTDLPDPKNPGATVPFSNYFHFDIAPLLFRIDRLFGPEGNAGQANRLQPSIHRQIVSLFADFVRTECPLLYANPNDTWTVYDSENHEAMEFGTCWAGARLLVDDTDQLGAKFIYADGSRPRQQIAAWAAYFAAYERERAKRGMFVEYFSDEYAKYSLMTFYNLVDFARDLQLRAETGTFLNLWWADWAEEQIDGFNGGAKTRFYPRPANLTNGTPVAGIPWFYFNIGPSTGVQDPATMGELTSNFAPDPIIADIAGDTQGRGTYEAFSRRVGLETSLTPAHPPLYHMDYTDGGVFRYTYVTPSFIMGTSMYPRLPGSAWALIDSENRLNDLMLAGGKRITALPNPLLSDYRAFNDITAVQHKGVQIVAPLPAPYSNGAGGMQVWYSPGLTPLQNGGWVFFEDSAYVAVHAVKGMLNTDPAQPNWLICSNPSSAVIIEAVPPTAYSSFQAFENAILASHLVVHGSTLSFTGLSNAGDFLFSLDGSTLPSIDGTPINVAPRYAYRSPFLREIWGSGVITVTKDNKSLKLDFTNPFPGGLPHRPGGILPPPRRL